MTNKARQHTVKGTILCEAIDYSGKVSLEFAVFTYPYVVEYCCLSAGLERSGKNEGGQENQQGQD